MEKPPASTRINSGIYIWFTNGEIQYLNSSYCYCEWRVQPSMSTLVSQFISL